jgi:O-antigen ligase
MNLLKKSIVYFPGVIILSLIIWPDYELNLREFRFPAIKIGSFSIRITEIIFMCMVLLFLFWKIAITLIKKREPEKKPEGLLYLLSFKKRYMRYISISIIILLAYSFVSGVLKNNPYVLLDIRGLMCILFLPMFFYSLNSIDQIVKAVRVLYGLLFIMAIGNMVTTLGNWSPFFGGVNNLTIIMNFYLFCLAISFLIYRQGKFINNLFVLFVALVSSLATLAKFMILAIVIAIVISILLAYLISSFKAIRYIALFLFVFSLIIALFSLTNLSSVLFKKNLGQFNISNFQEYIDTRVLREDIGDLSGGRFEIWQFIFKEISKNPILGNGLGERAMIVEDLEKKFGEYVGVHNLILWVLIRIGFLGAFLLLIAFFRIFRASVGCLKNEEQGAIRALLHSHMIFILGYLSINMVSLFFFIFEPAIIFWSSLAILFYLYKISLTRADAASPLLQ